MCLLYAAGSAFFCGDYFDTGKMRHPKGGFNRSDGDTDIRYFNFFMAHCRSSWFVESDR